MPINTDGLWQAADSEDVLKAQREAEQKMKAFTSDQILHMRNKAKNNVWWLAYSVLGYNLVDSRLHKDFSGWLHQHDDDQYRCILLPRSHLKSTIATISDTIRIVLTDDMGTSPYPRNLGPNARVLIGHEIHDSAAVFLNSITDHFMINPLLMGLFPELVPDARKQRINKHELELPRQKIWSEPTIDTVGVGGRRQGRHYNYIKLDDITGAEARDSEATNKATKLWFDNIQSFLITPKTDHIDLIGTRWAFDDIYQHAFNAYEEQMIKYIRSCLEKDPSSGELAPIFPEQFTLESIRILMKNRIVWNANYANNPSEGGTHFKPEWKRYYRWVSPTQIVSGEGADLQLWDTRDLDRIILVDPAMSGNAGYIITGTDKKNNIICLKAKKHTWSPPEFVEELFQDVVRWNPRIVVIEDVLFSGLYQHWLATEMNVRGIKFKVEPCKTRQQQKEARVLGLSNYFSARQIYFNQGQTDLIEEFDQFGATDDYHILDALAQGPKYWRAPLDRKRLEGYKETEQQWLQQQDPNTGYSTMD